ncbi:hypothetical protein ABTN17_20100, partial [Acinetobacter baumannii]
MSIDQGVLNNLFVTNPALNGQATVSIFKQEILLDIVGDDFYYSVTPTIETIGNKQLVNVNQSSNTISFDGIRWDPTTYNKGYIRLT